MQKKIEMEMGPFFSKYDLLVLKNYFVSFEKTVLLVLKKTVFKFLVVQVYVINSE